MPTRVCSGSNENTTSSSCVRLFPELGHLLLSLSIVEYFLYESLDNHTSFERKRMNRRELLGVALIGGSAGQSLIPPLFAMGLQGTDFDTPLVPPPEFATVLFDGKDLSGWVSRRDGPAQWKVSDGYVEVVPGHGHIYTEKTFGDFQLHLEFWLPYMPQAKGQLRANSGVYLHGRYEIQVLDSYGLEPQKDDCGAIYNFAAPLRNACKKPQKWQSYDVALRAPRLDQNGQIKENPLLTVFQNGILIHNNLELIGPSGGALDPDVRKPGPLMLQDHDDLVRYRNIWVVS
jgi:hypothetical protein